MSGQSPRKSFESTFYPTAATKNPFTGIDQCKRCEKNPVDTTSRFYDPRDDEWCANCIEEDAWRGDNGGGLREVMGLRKEKGKGNVQEGFIEIVPEKNKKGHRLVVG